MAKYIFVKTIYSTLLAENLCKKDSLKTFKLLIVLFKIKVYPRIDIFTCNLIFKNFVLGATIRKLSLRVD